MDLDYGETTAPAGVDLITAFFTAADRRDYKGLKQCLKAGVDPNIFQNYNTILHVAAMNGDTILLEYLMKLKEVDINIRTQDFYFTPLHLATRNQQVRIVRILLKNGADIEALARDEKRAIHLAALSCNITLLKVLLKFKPDLDVIDTFSHTPLSIVVLDRRNYHAAEYLCRHKARPYLDRPASLPLLFEAILNYREGDLRMLELLCSYGSTVNETDNTERNALHCAAIAGAVSLVSYLFYKDCDAEQKDMAGRTPIEVAVLHGNHAFALAMSNHYNIEVPRERPLARAIKADDET